MVDRYVTIGDLATGALLTVWRLRPGRPAELIWSQQGNGIAGEIQTIIHAVDARTTYLYAEYDEDDVPAEVWAHVAKHRLLN